MCSAKGSSRAKSCRMHELAVSTMMFLVTVIGPPAPVQELPLNLTLLQSLAGRWSHCTPGLKAALAWSHILDYFPPLR